MGPLISGHPEAWQKFVRDYQPIILRAARLIAGEGDAEDVAQKVMTLLVQDDYRMLRSFQGRSKISTWLIAITRRQALMHRREEGRRTQRQQRDLRRDLDCHENSEELQTAIAALEPKDRLLIALYYYEDLSYAEIAEILDISPNSVSPLLTRIRDRLRLSVLKTRNI